MKAIPVTHRWQLNEAGIKKQLNANTYYYPFLEVLLPHSAFEIFLECTLYAKLHFHLVRIQGTMKRMQNWTTPGLCPRTAQESYISRIPKYMNKLL